MLTKSKMAKKSSVEKNNKRLRLVATYEAARRELRKQVVNIKLSDSKRQEAQLKLEKLPRNGSRIRVRNRCYVTGRARGYLRRFGLSRLRFRKMASQGEIPGVIKASW